MNSGALIIFLCFLKTSPTVLKNQTMALNQHNMYQFKFFLASGSLHLLFSLPGRFFILDQSSYSFLSHLIQESPHWYLPSLHSMHIACNTVSVILFFPASFLFPTAFTTSQEEMLLHAWLFSGSLEHELCRKMYFVSFTIFSTVSRTH